MDEIPTVDYEVVESFLLALGLDPKLVRFMRVGPNQIDVTLYAKDADGTKYIDPETGDPAVTEQTMLVGRRSR